MVFSSLSFLYLFVPVTFILYFLIPNIVWRNLVLCAVSLIFYSWGEPKVWILMVAASLVAYAGGFVIQWAEDRNRPGAKKAALTVTVLLLVGNFFVFKYLGFVVENCNLLLHLNLPVPEIRLPIGISFYTFQILSYVIDLYRGKVKLQRNPVYLTLYVSLFPQLIAGPIVRYETVEQELTSRRVSLDGIAAGARRFIVGLGKKVLLANAVAPLTELIYAGAPEIYGTSAYWLAALAYTFQLYFDFSGYSDMAIGLGLAFGFHFPENFNYPYISRSVTEFWRRWHITLSTWFRDYVYIPLGGNRVSKACWLRNILVVWLLTGIWHGAGWNFLLWGLYYGVLLVLEKLLLQKWLDKLPSALRWVYTFLIVVVGWVIFNRTDFTQMAFALKSMFLYRPTDWTAAVITNSEILRGVYFIPACVVCMLPIFKKIRLPDKPWAYALQNLASLALALASVMAVLSSSYNPFIYFRF